MKEKNNSRGLTTNYSDIKISKTQKEVTEWISYYLIIYIICVDKDRKLKEIDIFHEH